MKTNCILSTFYDVLGERMRLGKDAKTALIDASIGYIFDVYKYAKTKAIIGDEIALSSRHYINYRMALISTYDTIIALKMTVINLIHMDKWDRKTIHTVCKRNGLSTLNTLMLSRVKTLPCFPMLKKRVELVPDPTMSADGLRHQCGEEIRSLESSIRGFCARKLRFITKHNNMKSEDLEGELRERVIRAFYQVAPFLKDKHLTNFLKKTIHNGGLKILSFYTTQKRCRIKDDGRNGYTTTIETLSNLTGERDEEKSHLMMHSAVEPDTAMFHNRLCLNKYITVGPRGRDKIVAFLLLQAKDQNFVRFAKAATGIRLVEECEDILDRVGFSKYYSLIGQYLCVPEKTVNRVRTDLQHLLVG